MDLSVKTKKITQSFDIQVAKIPLNTLKRRPRPQSCCKISIKIPSVELEHKRSHSSKKQQFPLRSNSVPKIEIRAPITLTPTVSQVKLAEKQGNHKSLKKGYIGALRAYEEYLSQPIDSILTTHMPNLTPIPDPHILEHKRAFMRLRKLKRIKVKENEENNY